MRQLWEAAFKPPPRAADAGAGDQSRFAVLPQNSEEELTLSEVHSKLDRALTFLQRDVGYALLDDVRPHTGGGVRLRPPQKANAAVPKGDRSCRAPKEEPLERASSDPPKQLSPEDLDESIIKLLRVIFERSGGRLRASELAEEVYRRQASNFRLNGQLDRLFRGIRIDEDREITWEEFQALHAESKGAQESGTRSKSAPASASSTAPAPQADGKLPSPKMLSDPAIEEVISISPDAARYAHYQCDLVLVTRFAQILYKSIMQDLYKDAEAGITTHADAKKRCNLAICHDGLYKCVLQGVRLMHLCDYDYADVVLVLGYASVYFRSTFSSIGKKMSPNEAAHVVVLLIYLAHAFLLDETCPLRIWQKHIFRKYCTLKVLDAALFRLFQMRPGFKLRISDEEERVALLGLSGVTYALKISDDDKEEANDAIKQLMGGITHPKLSENKDTHGPGSAANGFSSESNRRSSAHNGASPPGTAPGSSRSHGSGGSNGRSPPGSGQSTERHVEVPTRSGVTVDRTARVEAGNLLTSSRREGHQRRTKDLRTDEGALPLVSHADIPRSAATAAVAK